LTANQLRNAREANGVIVIGEFEETFTVPLEYWNAEDYRRHWKASLLKLLQKEDSCLITSMHDPEKANFILLWLLYSREEQVILRNQLLFMKTLSRPFTPDDPYPFIPKYESKNEVGHEISEWILPLSDFEEFLGREFPN